MNISVVRQSIFAIIALLSLCSIFVLPLSAQEERLLRWTFTVNGSPDWFTEYHTDRSLPPRTIICGNRNFQLRVDGFESAKDGFSVTVTRTYAADSEELRERFPEFNRQLLSLHRPMIDAEFTPLVEFKTVHHIETEEDLIEAAPEILDINAQIIARFAKLHVVFSKLRDRLTPASDRRGD